MSGQLIPLGDRAGWEAALDGIPHGFTHTWEHCNALSLTTGRSTFLWSSGTDGDGVVCPFMERPFDDFIDIATPPGVAGFAGTGDAGRLRGEWAGFVRDRRYVSGYFGLHPVFCPPAWQTGSTPYNSLYIIDLQQSSDSLLQRMDRNRRRELRAHGELSDRIIMDRVRLCRYLTDNYSAFANRIALPEAERWTSATLRSYCDASAVLLLGMEGPDGIVAAHLYAYSPYAADFVLQIADPDGRQYTTMLTWHAIELLKAKGVPRLNLGGGVDEGDAIARAKRRMGADRHVLMALREVYDRDAYTLLCRRTGQNPESPGYFPAYRRAIASAVS